MDCFDVLLDAEAEQLDGSLQYYRRGVIAFANISALIVAWILSSIAALLKSICAYVRRAYQSGKTHVVACLISVPAFLANHLWIEADLLVYVGLAIAGVAAGSDLKAGFDLMAITSGITTIPSATDLTGITNGIDFASVFDFIVYTSLAVGISLMYWRNIRDHGLAYLEQISLLIPIYAFLYTILSRPNCNPLDRLSSDPWGPRFHLGQGVFLDLYTTPILAWLLRPEIAALVVLAGGIVLGYVFQAICMAAVRYLVQASTFIIRQWGPIKVCFKNLWAEIKDINVRNILPAVSVFARAKGESLKAYFANLWNNIKVGMSQARSSLSAFFAPAYPWVRFVIASFPILLAEYWMPLAIFVLLCGIYFGPTPPTTPADPVVATPEASTAQGCDSWKLSWTHWAIESLKSYQESIEKDCVRS